MSQFCLRSAPMLLLLCGHCPLPLTSHLLCVNHHLTGLLMPLCPLHSTVQVVACMTFAKWKSDLPMILRKYPPSPKSLQNLALFWAPITFFTPPGSLPSFSSVSWLYQADSHFRVFELAVPLSICICQ